MQAWGYQAEVNIEYSGSLLYELKNNESTQSQDIIIFIILNFEWNLVLRSYFALSGFLSVIN